MPQDRAVVPFGLMMVAKAVAGVPTATERLEGRTAAVTGGDSAAQGSSAVAKSKTPPPKLPACRQTPDGLIAIARTSSIAEPDIERRPAQARGRCCGIRRPRTSPCRR